MYRILGCDCEIKHLLILCCWSPSCLHGRKWYVVFWVALVPIFILVASNNLNNSLSYFSASHLLLCSSSPIQFITSDSVSQCWCSLWWPWRNGHFCSEEAILWCLRFPTAYCLSWQRAWRQCSNLFCLYGTHLFTWFGNKWAYNYRSRCKE